MRGVLLLCLLGACTRNETLDEARLVPGESLGPVRLGSTRADVDRTGLTVRIDPSAQGGDQVNFAGPFTVNFDPSGHVESIAIDLNKVRRGVQVGSALIEPKDTLETALQVLAPCEPGMSYHGGTAYRCQQGTVRVERSLNEYAPLRIRVLRPATDLEPGSPR